MNGLTVPFSNGKTVPIKNFLERTVSNGMEQFISFKYRSVLFETDRNSSKWI